MPPKTHQGDRQFAYLYDVQWTPEIDHVFIDTLAFHARIGNFVRGESNFSAVVSAKNAITRRCNADYTIDLCLSRVKQLLKRYTTIEWMTSLSLVHFDPEDNVIHAPNVIWDFMVKVLLLLSVLHFGIMVSLCTHAIF